MTKAVSGIFVLLKQSYYCANFLRTYVRTYVTWPCSSFWVCCRFARQRATDTHASVGKRSFSVLQMYVDFEVKITLNKLSNIMCYNIQVIIFSLFFHLSIYFFSKPFSTSHYQNSYRLNNKKGLKWHMLYYSKD